MIRGWLLLSALVFSVLFKLFNKHGIAFLNDGHDWAPVHFLFSKQSLNRESWVYYCMEHLNDVIYAACLLISDSTPRFLLWVFFAIMVFDWVHFLLFFKDEGIGFNLAKVLIYIIAFAWSHKKS